MIWSPIPIPGRYSSPPAEVRISRIPLSGSLPIYFLLFHYLTLLSSPGGNVVITLPRWRDRHLSWWFTSLEYFSTSPFGSLFSFSKGKKKFTTSYGWWYKKKNKKKTRTFLTPAIEHLNTHYIVIITSEPICTNFQGGPEGSIRTCSPVNHCDSLLPL